MNFKNYKEGSHGTISRVLLVDMLFGESFSLSFIRVEFVT